MIMMNRFRLVSINREAYSARRDCCAVVLKGKNIQILEGDGDYADDEDGMSMVRCPEENAYALSCWISGICIWGKTEGK